MNSKFDDIRPYYPSELAPAMQRIADNKHFPAIAGFIFPDRDPAEVRDYVRNIRTVEELQLGIMSAFLETVLKKSAGRFTHSGLEYLHPEGSYLFVSNHRDITLDAMLFQYLLTKNGLPTTEVSFGSNLMSSQLVIDIGKSNKMFTVFRGGNLRDFYNNSQHLSDYIRHTITGKKESVWIAQRNGRTKDGDDATDQGIIKMFCMSDTSDPVRSAATLHIVPMAISYQIEPCDTLKTQELYLSRGGRKYIKKEGEDLNSILTGMTQPKGDIHISICKPLEEDELKAIPYKLPNEFHKGVAALIDRRIREGYQLYGNNYIAHDIRSGKDTYSDRYTTEEKAAFTARCEQMLQQIEGNKPTLLSIFLGIYANPVDNKPEKNTFC
ncbi:MAG: 1-acyl-sn-glycerol-3-phosphate acyltransferase [Tannerella sp.]|jgi:hypothetical protein|nr:1-acyl-sn-glycerol-3-phosphate acyltransferase [Tannerella sp.]